MILNKELCHGTQENKEQAVFTTPSSMESFAFLTQVRNAVYNREAATALQDKLQSTSNQFDAEVFQQLTAPGKSFSCLRHVSTEE